MSVITTMRRQLAVYWAPGLKDPEGNPTYGAPIEIKCRWEDVNIKFLGSLGEELVSNSQVYVDRVLKVGGLLWLGDIGSAPIDPTKDYRAYEIKQFQRLPNFRNTEELLTAMV